MKQKSQETLRCMKTILKIVKKFGTAYLNVMTCNAEAMLRYGMPTM